MYTHRHPHNWPSADRPHDHEVLPHHNDRGACAVCLTPIRRLPKAEADYWRARGDAQSVTRMTVEQAAQAAGLLGRIAPAMLAARGWYAFVGSDAGQSERTLWVRPDFDAAMRASVQ